MVLKLVQNLASENFCLISQLIFSPLLKSTDENLTIVKPFELNIFGKFLILSDVILSLDFALGLEPPGVEIRKETQIILVEL